MSKTKISWSEYSWNPVVGCSRVSEGCRNCYAERMAWRHQNNPRMNGRYTGTVRKTSAGVRWTGSVNLVPAVLAKPLKWRRPRRVFVNSMSDLFHEAIPDGYIAAVFGVMAACPQHTFQVLTKRPERALRWFRWASRLDRDDDTYRRGGPAAYDICQIKAIQEADHRDIPTGVAGPWPLPNVWLGVSVEDQATADDRIPLLLQCPASVRFVSAEPLLGPLVLNRATIINPEPLGSGVEYIPPLAGLNWVIVGGESGPGARPFNAHWGRSIVEQCRAAGVACFVKQLGPQVYDAGGRDHGRSVLNYTPNHFGPKGDRFDHPHWPLGLRVREYPTDTDLGTQHG